MLLLCAVGLLYLSCEAISLLGLSFLSRWRNVFYEPIAPRLSSEQRSMIRERLGAYEQTRQLPGHHPALGWTTRKAYASPDGTFVFNRDGIRAQREFAAEPPAHVLRIATFGDSFTLGSDVSNEETWQERVARARDGLEVLNFGVGGYGLDQAYLRYLHDGVNYRPHVVVIGFMSENIFRNVNVFRPFYSNAYAGNLFTKPRFLLDGDRLVLRNNPVATVEDLRRLLEHDERALREFGQQDYHYQLRYVAGPLDISPSVRLVKIFGQTVRQARNGVLTHDGSYDTRSEAFRVTERIFDEFYRAVLRNNALPIIMIYPDRPDMRTFAERKVVRYRPLLERLESKQYRFLDLMQAFHRHDPAFRPDDVTVGRWGHYNGRGNQIVANFVLRYLEEHQLASRTLAQRRVSEERARLGL